MKKIAYNNRAYIRGEVRPLRVGMPKNAKKRPKNGILHIGFQKSNKGKKMSSNHEIYIQKKAGTVTFAGEDVQKEKTWQT